MADSTNTNTTWLNPLDADKAFEFHYLTIALTILALVFVPVAASFLGGRANKLPVVNPPKLFEIRLQKQLEFVSSGLFILRQGRERFPGKPFVLNTHRGPYTILPPERAHEIRNLKSLNMRTAFCAGLPANCPGLESNRILMHPSEVSQKVVTKHLTKRLNTITEPLARETSFAVGEVLGASSDWIEAAIYPQVLEIIARLSSRVFLGSEVCRNEEWLDITKNFTVAQNEAIERLRLYPSFLRFLIYHFDPACRRTEAQWRRANSIVQGVVAQRRREQAECAAKGLPAPVYNDAIEWGELETDGGMSYNPTNLQLGLSFAAIHTSTDLLCQTLLHLATHPGTIEALREEMLEVLPAHGWAKSTLVQLKLLDSALKEAQRLKPFQMLGMIRKVEADTVLENGLSFRRGEYICVDAFNLRNPAIYENPDEFDMYRFRKMRDQPGGEHKAQLVSTSIEDIAFGHGKYACPGRFFAANEIKIAICYMLLRYDWKAVPGTTTVPVFFGTDPLVDRNSMLAFRRRKEEIDLDALKVEGSAVAE
ncbi:hypothetical protein RB600_001545 [Gaeumannomyces tritici]